MSIQSQSKNMQTIYRLVSQDLGYIFGEHEYRANGAKKVFHSKSVAFLRAMGKDLGFVDFKVTSNPGGIAVSGEITLMGMWEEGNGLYLQLFQSVTNLSAFMYRHIKHMKDYTGGPNRWLPYILFEIGDYEKLIAIVSSLRNQPEAVRRAS